MFNPTQRTNITAPTSHIAERDQIEQDGPKIDYPAGPASHGQAHIQASGQSAAPPVKPQRHAFQQALLQGFSRDADSPDWNALANSMDVSTPRLLAIAVCELSENLRSTPETQLENATLQLVSAANTLPAEKSRQIIATIDGVLPHLSDEGVRSVMNALNPHLHQQSIGSPLKEQLNKLQMSTQTIQWRKQVLNFGRMAQHDAMTFIRSQTAALSSLEEETLKSYVRTIAVDLFHIPDQDFPFKYESHLVPILFSMRDDQRALVMAELAEMLRVDQDPDNQSAFPALGTHGGIIKLLVDWVSANPSRRIIGLAGPSANRPTDMGLEKLAKAASEWIAHDAGASFANRDAPLMPVNAMVMWASYIDEQKKEIGDIHANHLMSTVKNYFLQGERNLDEVMQCFNAMKEYCTTNGLFAAAEEIDRVVEKMPSHAYLNNLVRNDVLQEFIEKIRQQIELQPEANKLISRLRLGRLENEIIRSSAKGKLDLKEQLLKLAEKCRKKKFDDLAKNAEDLAHDIPQKPMMFLRASLNHNNYGRVFETEFVKALFASSPAPLINGVKTFGEEFVKWMDNFFKTRGYKQVAFQALNTQDEDLQSLWLKGERSPSPLLNAFLNAENPDKKYRALQEFFENPQSGYDCATQMFIVRNMFMDLMPSPENPLRPDRAIWESNFPSNESHYNYKTQVLIPRAQREKNRRLAEKINSFGPSHAGITLPGQLPAWTVGHGEDNRPVSRYRPSLAWPGGEVVNHMLNQGFPHVAGVSGSAASLIFLLAALREKNPDIDSAAAVVSMAMYMNRIGGHSMYEVLSIANDLNGQLNLNLNVSLGQTNEDGMFTPDFNKLIELSPNPEWIAGLRQAVDTAWNETIAYRNAQSSSINDSQRDMPS